MGWKSRWYEGEQHPAAARWPQRVARASYARQEALPPAWARGSVRCAVSVTAVINFGPSYSAAWPVRDLSMTGAFVEMLEPDLREGMAVEFVLRADYHGRELEHRLAAVATRVTPEGAAFEFGAYDDAAYTDLANLLYAV